MALNSFWAAFFLAHQSGVVGNNVVFQPMGRDKFGVAGGVDSADVGEFLEKAGQLGLNADIVDVGVVDRVGIKGLDDETGASLCQVPAPVISH